MASGGTARREARDAAASNDNTAVLAGGQGPVSELLLLDVLYELLAQGCDAHSALTTADIEGFLHEHARNPKSTAEILAFFTRFGLPTDPQMVGADPKLREMASGLYRERGPASSMFPQEDTMARSEASAEPVSGFYGVAEHAAIIEPDDEPITVMAVSPPPVTSAPLWLWVAVGVLAMGFVMTLVLGYVQVRELEARLDQVSLQQRSTDALLTALDQRAVQLQDTLRESERSRRSLDRTFQTYIAEQAAQRQADQEALRSLLGARYQKLMQPTQSALK